MVPYLRAANVKDGALDLTDVKEMNFDPREQAVFNLESGDILVTEGSGSLRAVGASAVWRGEIAGTVCFQNTLLRLRPRPSTDPRFLAWWCRFAFGDGLFASVATGANIFHVSADRVRALPMTYLGLPDQRAIADYLDTETTRIDALIAKKRSLLDLGAERQRSLITSVTSEGTSRRVRQVTSLRTSGPRGWAELVADTGTPFIRSANLRRESVDLKTSNLIAVTAPRTDEARRSMVERDDVLVGITGANTGWVAIAGDAGSGGYVSQHVAILRPSGVVPEWLAYSIFSTRAQEQLLGGQYGGTKQQLGLDDLAELRINVPPIREQVRLVEAVKLARARHEALSVRLNRQIDLLVEHRQALITAAVTGELEIPGVAA